MSLGIAFYRERRERIGRDWLCYAMFTFLRIPRIPKHSDDFQRHSREYSQLKPFARPFGTATPPRQ